MVNPAAFTVVLARPQDPGNIGSTCRAMKTMGLTRLRIVEPAPRELHLARVLAVHALDVLETSERFATVDEAVKDCSLVVGVTRREGKWRKQIRLTPEELAERVARRPGLRAALVFGNEESGLSDTELEPCHLGVFIPSSPLFPSLNLSHAVQLVCYALFRRLETVPAAPSAPLPPERTDAATEAVIAALREAGFFTQGRETEMRLLFRDLLTRAALSESEAARVERCFSIQRRLVARLRAGGGAGRGRADEQPARGSPD